MVPTIADGNCLYRALSIALFGWDYHWQLLKLGCMAHLILNKSVYVDKVNSVPNNIKLINHFIIEKVNDSSLNFK